MSAKLPLALLKATHAHADQAYRSVAFAQGSVQQGPRRFVDFGVAVDAGRPVSVAGLR